MGGTGRKGSFPRVSLFVTKVSLIRTTHSSWGYKHMDTSTFTAAFVNILNKQVFVASINSCYFGWFVIICCQGILGLMEQYL